jgi:hypothetical protein
MDRLSCLAVILPLLSALGGSPALAESQSSSSASNCSGGRCSRMDSLVFEGDRGLRRYFQHERWTEREAWRHRQDGPAAREWREKRDRRGRRDRDDDDDD